jgi:hypothetical protein
VRRRSAADAVGADRRQDLPVTVVATSDDEVRVPTDATE